MTEHNSAGKDKHVKISADRHQKLKIISAKTGREMREIIEDAFDQYVQNIEDNNN